jgi:predicted XRE-type DNA-binding protein
MSASDSRKRRSASTLFDREMSKPKIRELVDAEQEVISLELQFRRAMEAADVSPARLADMLDVPASSVSRDLNGGLSNAKLGRLRAMASKLNYEIVPLVLPREPGARQLAVAAYLEKLK